MAIAHAATARHEPEAVQRMLLQGAALGTFAAAATHAAVMPVHFQQSWIYGTFFLFAMTGQVILGSLLLARPSDRIVVAGVIGSAAVIVLWGFSRVVGVPVGPDNGATEPAGVLDILASAAELATVLCGMMLLRGRLAIRGRRFVSAWRWSQWSIAMRLAMATGTVVVAVLTTVIPKS